MNTYFKSNFIVFFSLLSIFSACQYDDGPKFSLRSKKARAVNVWYLDQVYENGVDKTTEYKNTFVNYKLIIKSDDNYELSYRLGIFDYMEKGTWKFSSDHSKILFTPQGTSQENAFKILKLKNTETWAIANLNNKDVEIHLKD